MKYFKIGVLGAIPALILLGIGINIYLTGPLIFGAYQKKLRNQRTESWKAAGEKFPNPVLLDTKYDWHIKGDGELDTTRNLIDIQNQAARYGRSSLNIGTDRWLETLTQDGKTFFSYDVKPHSSNLLFNDTLQFKYGDHRFASPGRITLANLQEYIRQLKYETPGEKTRINYKGEYLGKIDVLQTDGLIFLHIQPPRRSGVHRPSCVAAGGG